MKEAVLQQIWNDGYFRAIPLRTPAGRLFYVSNCGRSNPGDGPDFQQGELTLEDGTRLMGDIELHTSEEEWYRHGHHTDPGYNGVMLHVFLHASGRQVWLEDGSQPLRLNVSGYLSAEMVEKALAGNGLPCAGKVSYINDRAFEEQLERARSEYFSQKVNYLSGFWEPGLEIEEAWKKMVLMGMAEGLGIEKNRRPMVSLLERSYAALQQAGSEAQAAELLLQNSGLLGASTTMKRQEWDLSASRPGNKPKERIEQLAALVWRMRGLGRRALIHHPESCWDQLVAGSVGGKRVQLLHLIVWLPAVYMLGLVVGSKKMCAYAFTRWQSHHYRVDPVLMKPFEQAGFARGVFKQHLGTAYQWKYYCTKGRCASCKVGRQLPAG